MTEKHDDKLESMLGSRQSHAASADLAERIILRAQSLPQIQNLSLWQSLRQLFVESRLPRPGYVLAGTLIFGMLVGYATARDETSIKETSYANTQSFLSGDEELL
jgi:hypothetical protein